MMMMVVMTMQHEQAMELNVRAPPKVIIIIYAKFQRGVCGRPTIKKK